MFNHATISAYRNIPSLKLISESVSVKTGGCIAQYPLYKLNWDIIDENKKESYKSWVKEYHSDKIPPNLHTATPSTLPVDLDNTVKQLVFAIPENYRIEIEHFVNLYATEVGRRRPFDTVISSMCNNIAIEAIKIAFKLLADCMYDTSTNTWQRAISVTDNLIIDKHISQSLLIYKFWRLNTGRGLVGDFAELNKLHAWAQSGKASNKWILQQQQKVKAIDCVLDMITSFEEEQEKYWSFTAIDGYPTVDEIDEAKKTKKKSNGSENKTPSSES